MRALPGLSQILLTCGGATFAQFLPSQAWLSILPCRYQGAAFWQRLVGLWRSVPSAPTTQPRVGFGTITAREATGQRAH